MEGEHSPSSKGIVAILGKGNIVCKRNPRTTLFKLPGKHLAEKKDFYVKNAHLRSFCIWEGYFATAHTAHIDVLLSWPGHQFVPEMNRK